MKRFSLIIGLVLMFVSPAFATWGDDNSTNQTTNVMSASGSKSDAKAISDSKSFSGSTAVSNQLGVVGQKAENDQNVNLEGDTNKTYANAWPALSGGEGVSQANAYSIFGGLGLSNTEKYKVYIVQIQAIEASKYLSDDAKKILVEKLFDKMIATNKTQRLFGVGPETSGRNLFNLFGILSVDSFWKDGQKPFWFQANPATVDTLETSSGNRGIVN